MQDWSKYISCSTRSHVGMRRSTNQDSYEVALASDMDSWQKRGHLFLVADGMGAHAAGELASKLAADGVSLLYTKYHELSPPEALQRAVVETNAEINRKGQANEEFNNMGTTCSALTLLPAGAVISHVGDSRVYRVRNNQLEQLTFDHSLVWEMRAQGTIPGGPAAENLIPKNVITRSLGPYPDVNVDIEGPFPIQVGDVFMLCSDGLTGEVEDAQIASLLSHLEPEQAAQALVDLANLHGGSDNVTVIVVKVLGTEMETRAQAQQNLTVGGTGNKTVSPLAYSLGGASLLATIICFATANLPVGIVLGCVTAIFAVWIAIRLTGIDSNEKVVGDKRFGRGPYTRTAPASCKKLLAMFEEIANDLKSAASESSLPVNLDHFEKSFTKAREAAAASDEKTMVLSFCSGMIDYMDQLRNQK